MKNEVFIVNIFQLKTMPSNNGVVIGNFSQDTINDITYW